MDSSVASLALRVRTRADRADAVRPDAERFTRRVLERCEALLDARAPGRILLMRDLELSIRIAERGLGDATEIEACAREVVDAVEQRAGMHAAGGAPSPGRDDDVVAFESDAHWHSAYLETLGGGPEPSAWYFEPLRAEGSALDLLAAAETPALLRMLAVMDERGSLASMLAALTAPVIERLAARLGRGVPLPDAIETITISRAVEERVAVLAPSLRGAEAWVHLAVAEYRDHGTVSSEAQPSPSVCEAYRRYVQRRRFQAGDGSATSSGTPVREGVLADTGTAIECAYGGVFYFLSLVMELSIAEALWCACLSEGPFLATVAGALIGGSSPDSIEARTFGSSASPTAQPVSREQRLEISSTVLAALIEALPRRGLSAWPEVCVRLAGASAGRLLVAQDMLTRQVLFVAPAGDPEDITGALEQFLGVWPLSAPSPRAERGLVTLDRRARLRPLAAPPVAEPLIVEGETVDDTAVLTQATGSLAHLFLSRVGDEASVDPAAALRDLLAIPASLVFDADTLTVRLSIDHLDIRVRRAGLDADPGWIPWLQRHVRFEYVEPLPGTPGQIV